MIFFLCSSSVFDIGDVWNVYKLGVKYVWVLHKLSLWQDSVECWQGFAWFADVCRHLLVSIYRYLLVFICTFWCLPFLFSAVEPSAAKRSEAALNYIILQVWEQVWQSRARLLLITCWKVWGSLWILSFVLLSISSFKRASRSHAETGLFWSFLHTFSGSFFRRFSGGHLCSFSMIFVCPWGPVLVVFE